MIETSGQEPQRYAFDAFGPSHPGGVIIHDPEGVYVTYDDHLAAVRQAREAALREAKEAAISPPVSMRHGDDWIDRPACDFRADSVAAIRRLIDGGSDE